MSVLSNHILSLYGVYSTFLLNKGYQGALLQVRRTEDNVLAEVYPDSTGKISLNSYVRVNKLESQARNLGNFACAPGFPRDLSIGINVSVELRVSKVYNQSLIQNNDLEMTTQSSQPIIFISNTLKSNTLGPSIYFDNHSLTIPKLPTNFTYHTCIKPLTSKNYTSTYFTNSTNTIKAFSEYSTTTNIFKARVAGLLNRGVGIDNFYSFNKQQIDDKAYGDVQINQVTALIPERFLTFECESDPALYNTNPYTISPYGDVNFIVIYDDQLTPIKKSNRIRRQETSQLLAQYNQGLFDKLNRINPQSVLNKYPTPKYAFACKSLTGKFGGTRQPLVEVIRGANTTNRVIVYADNKGEISLDSVVTLSNGASSATKLGEFAGAPGYANPDNVAESNIFTYRLINQVDRLDSNDYSPTVVAGHQNYPVLYNASTKLQKINTYTALFNSTLVAPVAYQFNVTNGGGQSVIGVYLNRENIGTLMGDGQFGTNKAMLLTFGATGPYYVNNGVVNPYTVPNFSTNPHPSAAPNVPTITSFFRSDTSSYRVKTNGKLYKVSSGLALADLVEQNFIGPIQGAVAAIIGYDCDITSFEEDLTKELKTLFITTPSPAKGLLDTYPNAAAAYSLRRLKADAPAAIRVRRASDSTERNIGFNNDGSLNTTDLTTFCSGTNCFVKVWFDQSGNVNNATQTTTANQPKIYDSVTGVVLENGKPAIEGDGTDGKHLTTSNTVLSADLAVITVCSFDTSNLDSMIFGGTTTATKGYLWRSTATLLNWKNNSETGFANFTVSLLAANNLIFGNRSGKDVSMSVNGNNNTLTESATQGLDFTINRIGGAFENQYSFDGTYQEMIFYDADQSSNRTGIEQNINANYGIYWDGTQTGLLDTYPSAAAAYSVRALNSAYTGPILRVRRSSDNVEQDIYALYNGDLNIQSLSTFCAGTNCFVKTWYDQSGNANDATQTTTANQPKIYDSSTGVVMENSQPALDFDGTNDGLNNPTDLRAATGASSLFLVQNVPQRASTVQSSINIYKVQRFVIESSGSTNYNNIAISTNETANEFVKYTAASTTGQNLYASIWDGTSQLSTVDDVELYVDGVLQSQTAGTFTLGVSPSGTNSIGFRNDTNSQFCDGLIQEVIVYLTDQSANRSGIESNINSYFNIY